jgi:hypothetical protein
MEEISTKVGKDVYTISFLSLRLSSKEGGREEKEYDWKEDLGPSFLE